MKNKALNLLSCCFLVFTSTLALASHLKIQHWSATNGAKVYFVRIKSLPMLSINVTFKAGSAYDGKDWGLSSLTNNLIGEETTTLSGDEISQRLQSMGAKTSTKSNRDIGSISLMALTNKNYLSTALTTFSDAIAHLSISADTFSRAKAAQITEIKIAQQSPSIIAKNALFKELYGDQPYAHTPIGTLDSIRALTTEKVMNFYKTYYVAKNADIVLVGDISTGRAKTIANTISQALPKGEPAPILAMMTQASGAKNIHINFPSKQTAIAIGEVGMSGQSPNLYKLSASNLMLGQMPLMSLLYKSVREKRGLSYSISSGQFALLYRGPWIVTLSTRANKTQEAVDATKETIDHFIDDGISKKQLKLVKEFTAGYFPIQTLSSNNAIIASVSRAVTLNRPLDYLNTYLKKINSLTIAQANNTMRQTLIPNKMITITVGPNNGE